MKFISEDVIDEESMLTQSDIDTLCKDVNFSEDILDESSMLTQSDLDKLCKDVNFSQEMTLSPEETVVEPEVSNVQNESETVVEPEWNRVKDINEINRPDIIPTTYMGDVEIKLSDLLNTTGELPLIDLPEDEIEEMLNNPSNVSEDEMKGYIEELLVSDLALDIHQVRS